MGKHFIDPKSSDFCPFLKFFLVRRKLPFFGQNCSLPFSLRSLDIPALLKSGADPGSGDRGGAGRFTLKFTVNFEDIFCK
jgi:hypothetical protein